MYVIMGVLCKNRTPIILFVQVTMGGIQGAIQMKYAMIKKICLAAAFSLSLCNACALPVHAEAGAAADTKSLAESFQKGEEKLAKDFLLAEKNKVQIRKVRLVWDLVPEAVMYELVVTKGISDNPADIVTTKQKIYTNGYELDTSVFNMTDDNLYWKVRGLDIDGRALSSYTEPRPLLSGELNPQAPLATTEFQKMDYTPLYPVYSWVPYLYASEYEIQVFFDDDNKVLINDPLSTRIYRLNSVQREALLAFLNTID